MKIILALLLCSATLLRAEPEDSENEPPDPNNPPAEVELTPAEREALDLIDKGDASALKGEQEDAMSFWDEALTHKGAGDRQMQDARERLQWACPDNGIGGLGSDKPGQAFAFFRRSSFLGADEKQRKNFIREYCEDFVPNDRHPEIDAYADWLKKMLPEDKNFELLPLVLEGDLLGNSWWLTTVIPNIANYDFLTDPVRVMPIVKQLGGCATGGGFHTLMFNEYGNRTFMANIICQLSDDDDNGAQKKYQRTRDALKKFLMGLPSPSWDSDLMLTLLNRDDDKALATLLKKYGAKLASFEPQHLKVLLVMLERMKGFPKDREMNDLLWRGDASALAGDRDAAKGLWRQVMTITPEGIVPRRDALERLAWARPRNGVDPWKKENAGQSFASHMRGLLLAPDAALRESMIKEYCSKQNGNDELRAKFSSYAEWLSNVLSHDKNLKVLPLILEGELSENPNWLSTTLQNIYKHYNPKEPAHAIKLIQGLGLLGNADNFKPLYQCEGHKAPVLYHILLPLMKGHGDEPSRVAIRKSLAILQPRTFGADFILALTDDDEEKSLTVFLKEHAVELAGLEQQRREELLTMVKEELSGYPNTEDMDDSLVPVLRPLLPEGELKTVKLEDQLVEILGPDKLTKNESDKFPAAENAAGLIACTANHHPDKAIAGLKQAIGIIAENNMQKDPNCAPADKPLAALLDYLLFNPALFKLALQRADEAGLLADGSWLCEARHHWNWWKVENMSGKELVASFLTSDQFVGAADKFDPISFHTGYNGHTNIVLGEIAEKLRMNQPRLKSILEILRAQNPRTFGCEMMEIMIGNDINSVRDFIRRRSPEFVKIPAARRAAVLNCLCLAARTDQKNLASLAPDLPSILQPLLQHDPNEDDRLYDQFMRAPTLALLNLRPESVLGPAQRVLDDVAEQDAEKATRLADKVRDLIKGYPADRYGPHLSDLSSWQTVTGAIPELFGSFANEYEKRDGASKRTWMNSVPSQMTAYKNLPMRSVKMLRSGRFLDEAPTFRSYRLDHGNAAECCLATIVRQIKSDKRAVSAATEFLNKQPATFGVGLVQTLLDDKPDSLVKYLGKRSADLQKMPLEHHPEITLLCGIQHGSWLQLASVSPEWDKALHDFLPSHRLRVAEYCDKLLAARRIEDLEPRFKDLDPAQGDPWLKWLNVISEMKMIDAATTNQAVRHLLRLADDADREKIKGEGQQESSNEPSQVQNFMSWAAKFPALFRLYNAADESPEKPMERINDLSNTLNDIAQRPIEACILIDASGLLTDASGFDTNQTIEYMPPNSSGRLNRDVLILYILLDGIKSGGNEIRQTVIKYLSQHKPKTFGSEFLLALLAEDGATSVPAFLKAHENEMSNLHAESRTDALALLRNAWPEMPQAPDEKKK